MAGSPTSMLLADVSILQARVEPWIAALNVAPCKVVHVAICQVVSHPEGRDAMSSVLSAAELRTLADIGLPSARDEYATSRWLARILLARQLDTEPSSVFLDAPRLRRPRTTAPADVSISHADGLVAVAATPDGRVGVDVESAGAHLPALCRRFVPPYETPPTPSAAALAWVRWEAATKLGRPATGGSARLISSPDGRPFGLTVALAR